MKKLLHLVLIATVNFCFAQKIVVGTKFDVALAQGFNIPSVKKMVGDDPTLLGNMTSGTSLDLRVSTHLKGHLFVGAWGSLNTFRNWSAGDNAIYNGSELKMNGGGPLLMYHSSSGRNAKRTSWYLLLTPGAFAIKANTGTDLIASGADPLIVTSGRFSGGVHIGLTYTLSRTIGIYSQGGYQYTQSNSQIFFDESYSFYAIKFGMFFRFFSDHNYKLKG